MHFLNIFICAIAILFFKCLNAAEPPYGQLSVQGTHLVDSNGKFVQLRGIGLFWSIWMSKYWNRETIHQIKCAWNSNVVRLPMAICNGPCWPLTSDGGGDGYMARPIQQLALVESTIDAAIAEGLYVIVDWHEEQATAHLPQAKDFFDYISKKYQNDSNIIYEVYNEPFGKNWTEIKAYCEALVKVIRNNDPDGIIICPTPQGGHEPKNASGDLVNATNIMYTLHYYAGSDNIDWNYENQTKNAQAAIDNGVPLFVTEYGSTNDDANSGFNPNKTKLWWEFDEANKLSYVYWAMDDKDEKAAALLPVGDPAHWSESGKLINAYMQTLDNGVTCMDSSSTFSVLDEDINGSTTTAITKEMKARYPDSNGRYPDANGRYPDANGRYPDANGRYPDANCRYPDVYRRYPDENGQYPETIV